MGGELFYCNQELSGFLRDTGFFRAYILKPKCRIILLFKIKCNFAADLCGDDNSFGKELSDNFKQAGCPRQKKQYIILAAVSC